MDDLPVSEFGFPGPLRDALVATILDGSKTSTTGLLDGYRREGEGEGVETVADWYEAHVRFFTSAELVTEIGDPPGGDRRRHARRLHALPGRVRGDMAVVETIDLRRTYRTSTGVIRRRSLEVEAVRGVTFSIEEGELFGLLGPNGAGKTTTIKMLITLLIPTSGTARVLGRDVVEHARWVRERVGYVFGGDRGLYERLSALDNLRYFAELYGVEPGVQRTRIPELLELVGLSGREKERVEGYSRGMRQRLHIARGLLHDPSVLFLDEPTIGVDPVGARELRGMIAELRRAGKTVLLTTHYMFEADELCDRLAVVSKGRIVAEGTPRDLKAQVANGIVVEIEVYGIDDAVVDGLRALPGVTSVGVEEHDQAQLVVVQSATGQEPTQSILACLDGVTVARVTTREPTLEDAYVALVSESDS